MKGRRAEGAAPPPCVASGCSAGGRPRWTLFDGPSANAKCLETKQLHGFQAFFSVVWLTGLIRALAGAYSRRNNRLYIIQRRPATIAFAVHLPHAMLLHQPRIHIGGILRSAQIAFDARNRRRLDRHSAFFITFSIHSRNPIRHWTTQQNQSFVSYHDSPHLLFCLLHVHLSRQHFCNPHRPHHERIYRVVVHSIWMAVLYALCLLVHDLHKIDQLLD